MVDIRQIEERLTEIICSEFEKGIEYINTDEMGKVIDMLKDVSDARYHCLISDAMAEENYVSYFDAPYPLYGEDSKYYPHHISKRMKYADKYRITPDDYRRIEEMTDGRMYYTEPSHDTRDMQDERYGTSWEIRKKYYESTDVPAKMRTLEEYTHALTDDVMNMVKDMNENEKQMLRTKMQMLAQKI